MYKLLVADFNKLFTDRFLLLFPVCGLIVMDLFYTIVANHGSDTSVAFTADILFTDNSPMIPFVLALFAGSFLISDFKNGIIRNKVIAGAKRINIVLSNVIVMSMYAFYVNFLVHIGGLFFGMFFKNGYYSTQRTILTYTLIHLGASVALILFYMMIALLFHEARFASFIPIVCSVIVKVIDFIITFDLYNKNLSDRTFRLFDFTDSHLPSSYLVSTFRHGTATYYPSIITVIIVSVLVSIVYFQYKDLK